MSVAFERRVVIRRNWNYSMADQALLVQARENALDADFMRFAIGARCRLLTAPSSMSCITSPRDTGCKRLRKLSRRDHDPGAQNGGRFRGI